MLLPSNPSNGDIASDVVLNRLYQWSDSANAWAPYGGIARASLQRSTLPDIGELVYNETESAFEIYSPNGWKLLSNGGKDRWRQSFTGSVTNIPAATNFKIPFDIAPTPKKIPNFINDPANPGNFLNTASYTRRFHVNFTCSMIALVTAMNDFRIFLLENASTPNGVDRLGQMVEFDTSDEIFATTLSTTSVVELAAGEYFSAYCWGNEDFKIADAAFDIDQNYSVSLQIMETN